MSQEPSAQPVFKAIKSGKLAPVLQEEDSEEYPEISLPQHGLPAIGEVIQGRYLIEKMLGQGQFGWVYLVRHTWLGQRFAMKVMHPRVAHDPQWVERFRQEARQTCALGHDHIVAVTDFDHCPRFGYFFIMEHVEGITLSQLIKRQGAEPMSPERALPIIFQACDALAAMHEVGVVHRDLKPSNIMISQREGSDHVTLLDFGISSSVFEVSASQKLYGTPAYMAPEQTRTMQVDGRADQFALATILYHLLVGKRPWVIRSWSDASRRARAKAPVEPMRRKRAHPLLTAELDAVVARALSLEPERRFEDMRAFAHALYRALDGRGGMETSVDALKILRRSDEFPALSLEVGALPSLITLMPEQERLSLTEQTPSISVNVRTNDRLLRSWREEWHVGNCTLPTQRCLKQGSWVNLHMVLGEEQVVLALHGQVTCCEPPPQGGTRQQPLQVRVALDERSIKRLEQAVRLIEEEKQSGSSMRMIVRSLRPMTVHDRLSTGEAFLLSRLTEPMSVKQVAALFSNLSFDLERLLEGLKQKGLIAVDHPSTQRAAQAEEVESDAFFSRELDEDPGDVNALSDLLSTRRPGRRTRVDHSTGGSYLYSQQEIEQVIELVNYLKKIKNYGSAIQVLRRALDASPTVGAFYHQLALLHIHHERDTARAMSSIECALQLSPHEPEFLRTRDYIQTLMYNLTRTLG